MCDICRQVKPAINSEEKKKQIDKIYQQFVKEEIKYGYTYGRSAKGKKELPADILEEILRDATREWEDENEYRDDYDHEGHYGTLYPVECCGVREMKAAQAECENGFKLLLSEVSRKSRFGFLFATTVKAQVKEAKNLKARGFKEVGVFRNPNTANVVTFWVYNIHPIKKEKKSGEKKGDARLAA